MAAGKYIAVYDISDDKERGRVSKVLEGFGFRVQESAFECTLSRSGRDKLVAKLEELSLDTGFVNIYRINDHAKTVSIGRKPTDEPDDGCAFVV